MSGKTILPIDYEEQYDNVKITYWSNGTLKKKMIANMNPSRAVRHAIGEAKRFESDEISLSDLVAVVAYNDNEDSIYR